jgi:hypothetical protein
MIPLGNPAESVRTISEHFGPIVGVCAVIGAVALALNADPAKRYEAATGGAFLGALFGVLLGLAVYA